MRPVLSGLLNVMELDVMSTWDEPFTVIDTGDNLSQN